MARNDQPSRLANLVDIFGLCVRRLEESLAVPTTEERDLAGIVARIRADYLPAFQSLLARLTQEPA
jgi:hypothetical protein